MSQQQPIVEQPRPHKNALRGAMNTNLSKQYVLVCLHFNDEYGLSVIAIVV